MKNILISVAAIAISFSAQAQGSVKRVDNIDEVGAITFKQQCDGLPNRIIQIREKNGNGNVIPLNIVASCNNEKGKSTIATAESLFRIEKLPIATDGSEQVFIFTGNHRPLRIYAAPYEFVVEPNQTVVIEVVKMFNQNMVDERHGH